MFLLFDISNKSFIERLFYSFNGKGVRHDSLIENL